MLRIRVSKIWLGLLSTAAAVEEFGHLVLFHAVDGEIRAAVMDAAEEQSAVVLAVRVDGVNDLHARGDIEARGVSHASVELARVAIHIHARDNSHKGLRSGRLAVYGAHVTRREHDLRRVVVVKVEGLELDVSKISKR